MDIWAQNTTSSIVNYVKFDNTSLGQLVANGGGNSGTFTFTQGVGFIISVQIAANHGSGRVRVVRDNVQIACQSYTSSSSVKNISWDFAESDCPWVYKVYIESSSC